MRWDLWRLLELGCHRLGRLLLELLDLLDWQLLLAVVGRLLGVAVGLGGHVLVLGWRVLAGVNHLGLRGIAKVRASCLLDIFFLWDDLLLVHAPVGLKRAVVWHSLGSRSRDRPIVVRVDRVLRMRSQSVQHAASSGRVVLWWLPRNRCIRRLQRLNVFHRSSGLSLLP